MNKKKVIVYVDGYNFYYGLRNGGSRWKRTYWLDIVGLNNIGQGSSSRYYLMKSNSKAVISFTTLRIGNKTVRKESLLTAADSEKFDITYIKVNG